MYYKKKQSQSNRVAECYSRYGYTLYKIIDRKIQNPHVSEDILQELFLKMWQKGYKMDPTQQHTKKYLITAANNLIKDYLRQSASENEKSFNADFETLDPDLYPTRSTEDIYLEGEVVSTLWDTIACLSSEERSVFLRRKMLKHSIRRISRDTGISEYRIKKTLKEITKILRENLIDYLE
jgi:RNA polymerase sigma-70 factor (ECF subfamily)